MNVTKHNLINTIALSVMTSINVIHPLKQGSLGGLDSDFIEAMKVGSFKLTLSMVICFLYQDFYSKLKG